MAMPSKDDWLSDVERTLDEYPVYLTRGEAEGRLIALGFDPNEIREMLSEDAP